MYIVNNFVFFKQKTAYEMRISDWSSDVCSSDLESNDEPKQPAQTAPVDGGILTPEDQTNHQDGLDNPNLITSDVRLARRASTPGAIRTSLDHVRLISQRLLPLYPDEQPRPVDQVKATPMGLWSLMHAKKSNVQEHSHDSFYKHHLEHDATNR